MTLKLCLLSSRLTPSLPPSSCHAHLYRPPSPNTHTPTPLSSLFTRIIRRTVHTRQRRENTSVCLSTEPVTWGSVFHPGGIFLARGRATESARYSPSFYGRPEACLSLRVNRSESSLAGERETGNESSGRPLSVFGEIRCLSSIHNGRCEPQNVFISNHALRCLPACLQPSDVGGSHPSPVAPWSC